ncbi:MAG: DMT family transporter [Bacteroidales bacterium]|nr:DMT family transporter [Bacteroidales bacterium]
MLNDKRLAIKGAFAISFAAILWGLDGVILTPRLYNLDVGFVVMMVHMIPFLLMNIFLRHEYANLLKISPADFGWLALVSLFGGTIGTLAIVKALFLVEFKHLTIVVLLQKLQPIFAIALAAIILKEQLTKRFALWAGLAITAGYFLTFGFQSPSIDGGSVMLAAALFSLLAAFSFGSSTVFSKLALKNVSFGTATFFRYGFTAAIMLAFVLISGKISEIQNITSENWLVFIIIALTTGSGAIYIFYFGLRQVKAIVATVCELFFPISAIIFDYIFNGTRLSVVQWISAVIMIFSIIMLNLGKKKQQKLA